jgi:ribonucleoside-diphosphate reductase alpha chain
MSRESTTKSTTPFSSTAPGKETEGLHFDRVFSNPECAPFNEVDWELRSVEITDETGASVFHQDNVEVPRKWSALASKIAVSKYLYGDIDKGTDPSNNGRETSIRQLIHRVTRTIADWGEQDGYFANHESAETFYNELTWLCLNQYGAFNSPVVQRRPLSAIRRWQKCRSRQFLLESHRPGKPPLPQPIRISPGQRLLHPVCR